MDNQTLPNIPPFEPLSQTPTTPSANLLKISLILIIVAEFIYIVLKIVFNLTTNQQPIIGKPTISPTQVVITLTSTPTSTPTSTCTVNGQPCTQIVCPPMPTCRPGMECIQVMPPCVKYPGTCQNGQCLANPTSEPTSDWKMYSSKYGYTVKYPTNLEKDEIQPGYSVLFNIIRTEPGGP